MLALLGPSSKKRKRTGTGTSSTASSSTASRRRTKAMVGRERNSTQPTRTTVASAFSGIFSSSFSSCLDLERVIPAGGAGGGSSRWGLGWKEQGRIQFKQHLPHALATFHIGFAQTLLPAPRQDPLPFTSLSTSSRVSGTPPMRGSVT